MVHIFVKALAFSGYEKDFRGKRVYIVQELKYRNTILRH